MSEWYEEEDALERGDESADATLLAYAKRREVPPLHLALGLPRSHCVCLPDGRRMRLRMACRICHDEELREMMVQPCRCRGSGSFVHRGCLHTWRMKSLASLTCCSECRSPYAFIGSWSYRLTHASLSACMSIVCVSLDAFALGVCAFVWSCLPGAPPPRSCALIVFRQQYAWIGTGEVCPRQRRTCLRVLLMACLVYCDLALPTAVACYMSTLFGQVLRHCALAHRMIGCVELVAEDASAEESLKELIHRVVDALM